jgi:rRNA processing protein Gar1
MKQFLKITLLLPLALTGSMLIAQDEPDAKQPPEKSQSEQNYQLATVGKIVEYLDSRYVLVKYVLIDSADTVYQLDDQTTAKKFVGKIVKVSGAVDETNNTIHVTDITPAGHAGEESLEPND